MAYKTKKRKQSLEERLIHDEDMWTKLLGSMGDFARLWRQLKANEKRDRAVINDLEKRVIRLEKKLYGDETNDRKKRRPMA